MFNRSTLLVPLSLILFACDSAEPDCPLGERAVNGKCIAPVQVRVSSVGFRPERSKRATVTGSVSGFRVVRLADGATAFEGTAGPDMSAADTGEIVRVADFSALTEPGEYRMELDGGGRSAPFEIASDVYVDALTATMLGLHGQRCGTAVSFSWQGTSFSHAECHMGDGAAAKGWHDAGDYGKYTRNGAFALGMLLVAWDHFSQKLESFELDIPERGGTTPDFLDESAYQLEWLLGMQLADGSVVDRIAPPCFDSFDAMPERTSTPRPLSTPSTPATANFAAVAARAARAFEPYDAALSARAREAAQAAWAYLLRQTTAVPPPPADISCTGGYQSDSEVDDRLWAAAEIWETTGDADALATLERLAESSLPARTDWDWSHMGSLATFTYLGSTRAGRSESVVAALSARVIENANTMATSAEEHPYGRSLAQTYYWGINGIIARSTMGLVVAHRLTGDARYLDAASFQLDHLFGRNYYARSFVTGVGFDPPQNPHHRPSVADGVGAPWPGLLVGGPSHRETGVLTATTWVDASGDFRSNEVAINWNAAIAYALAAFLPDPAAP